jgi:GNAT superfamily N-acetyltransferase
MPAHATVGFVMFEPQPARFYIQELDVLTAHAGQRIGAALIEQVATLARAQQVTALTLSTFREVPWTAPYCRWPGFVDIDEAGLDESKRVFMRREL